MEKRYQVFVSSTYEDLQDERKAVMQALLELDFIPAGMELFPASSEEQWNLIKRVIDDSDYYVLILGGRYGSCNDEGMGYTEMEYRYAMETGKPIVGFLHKTPGKISAEKCEDTATGKKKLAEFRRLAQRMMVKYWTSPDSLALAVTASVAKLPKQFPAVGWIRADQAMDATVYKELLEAREEVARLREDAARGRSTPLEMPEDLACGKDLTAMYAMAKIKGKKEFKKIVISWNDLFICACPGLSDGCTMPEMKRLIEEELDNLDVVQGSEGIDLFESFFTTIKIQFRALGLIQPGRESGTWELTNRGEQEMIRLMAVRKQHAEEKEGALV